MAGTTRLQIYNGALMLCGERALAALTEDREPRRLLDEVWDRSGVRYCLEQGEWGFAMRAEQVEYDPSIEPPFGYAYAFNKTSDWVATHAVCSDPYFKQPLLQYLDEVENLYSLVTPIYVRFVSDDSDYGGDPAKWPQSFCDYVDAYFASKIIFKLTSDKQRLATLFGQPGKTDGGELGRRLKVAKNRAAMQQATRIPPPGSWNSARRGRGRGPMGDGGVGGALTG